VDNGLISKDLYASVVLAVLLSTIIPPFLLRFTINYYNKKAEETVKQVVQDEMKRKHDLESTIEAPDREHILEEGIRNNTAVFLCIQTQSEASWGLMHRLMAKLGKLGLEIIDHRAWSPRGVKTTLVNEIYAKDTIQISKGASKEILEARLKEINEALMKTIDQPLTSKVKVQRWYPGVVEEYTESVDGEVSVRTNKVLNLEQRLLEAATAELERKQAMQTAATQEKTVEEILKEMGKEVIPTQAESTAAAPAVGGDAPAAGKKPKRRRQKMRSTPVVGGGLFGEGGTDAGEEKHDVGAIGIKAPKGAATDLLNFHQPGHAAEIIVQGESYKIRISEETLKNLRKGYSGQMMDSRGISVSGGMQIQHDESNVVGRLTGYVRNLGALGMISEEGVDGHSETSDQKTTSHTGVAKTDEDVC